MFSLLKQTFLLPIIIAGLLFASCDNPTGSGGNNPVNAAQPSISTQPQGGTFDVGIANTFQLTVTAGKSDNGTLSYQWYENTINSATGGAAVGADSATLALNKTDYTANGNYYFYVAVTNTNNNATGIKTASVTSNVATLTVSGNTIGTNPPEFILPEDLKGKWVSVDYDNEEYIISDTEFTANDSGYGVTYAGTIVNHREAGSGAGYITIQYTTAYYGNGVGKFYVIHYKNLTSASVSISGAYHYDDPDFGINDTGGKASQAAAEAAYTVAGGYFSLYSDCTKSGSSLAPIPLVENQWANGNITHRDGIDVYTIAVTKGVTYYLWWNDVSDGPDPKNKTGDVDVRTEYDNGDTIFAWIDHAWSYSRSFTAASTDTVYVQVRPHGGSESDSYLGTYGIVFSTDDTRPEIGGNIPPADPVPLSVGVWADGRLARVDSVDVYTIALTGGVTYYVWWNDAFDGPHPKNKIGDVDVRAMYDNEETIFTWTNSGWTDPQQFTATRTSTVYVEVRPNGTSLGEYGITFNTASIRPGTVVSTFSLVNGQWANNTLADKDSLHVYTIAVTQNQTYNIWWNDKKAGDGTNTADVQVQARYGDDTLIFGQWVDSAWADPQPFTATRTGTVYVRVRPYNGEIDKPGAYGIVFSTDSTRPGSGSIDYANAVTLINNQWKDNTLANANSIDVYKFDVSGGQTYRLWWDQRGSGGGSKTAQIQVRAEYGDKSAIFGWQDNGWTNSDNIITPTTNGTVYLIVRPYSEMVTYTGTYGIAFSTGTTIPIKDNITFTSVSAVAGTPTPALTLTFDKAIPGLSATDITLSGIPGVNKGTLSGSGPSYTLPISGFSLGGTLTVAVAKTLYNISASSKTVNVTGTGGTPIPLVEKQWANGELPNASDVHWYTIAVTGGVTYNVWWDDRGQGQGGYDSKKADIDVLAQYADGSAVSGWSTPADDGWINPKSFTAAVTGIVYVRVRPYGGNSASFIGTYGIVFSTGSTRPVIRSPDDIPVTFTGVSASGSPTTTELILTFSAAITGLSAADITLSGIPGVSKGILESNGPVYYLPISGFPFGGTLTVKVEDKTGYDISGTTKTVTIISNSVIIPLVENQWKDGKLPTVSSIDWYTIALNGGTTYYLWWSDNTDGPSPRKTGEVDVTAYYSDGSLVTGWTGPVDSGWTSPRHITGNGTVYVRVRVYNGADFLQYIGTYGIVFSTGTVRPEIGE